MPRTPTPWWREDRQAWFVQISRKRHNLGKDKKQAWQRYHELMAEPQKRAVPSDSLAGIVDAFLEWVQKRRAPDTYEWYRYRLQRFIEQYPDLRAGELRPFHVETWADQYPGAVTSRRNYLRSVKRCLKWAKKQGYIDSNPIADMEVPSGEPAPAADRQVPQVHRPVRPPRQVVVRRDLRAAAPPAVFPPAAVRRVASRSMKPTSAVNRIN